MAKTSLSNRLARAGKHYTLHRPPSRFRADCSGFICAVMDRAGVTTEGNTKAFWRRAEAAGAVHHRPFPHAGDLVFFDNTYDRNGNGVLDDELSHIGIVLSVDADGTIVIAHAGTSKGRTTLRMNLLQPNQHRTTDGTLLNDFLRGQTSGDPRGTRYLSGELWRGFATVHPDELAIWAP